MRVRSISRRIIGVWLMVDAALTAMWFSTRADSLGGRDTLSVVMMVLRLGVAGVSAVAGWNIAQQRPQGTALGTIALALIAVFALVTAWSGVLPTNLDPAWRVPVALGTTAAAVTAMLVLRT
jgi:hypothetical protein